VSVLRVLEGGNRANGDIRTKSRINPELLHLLGHHAAVRLMVRAGAMGLVRIGRDLVGAPHFATAPSTRRRA